MRIAFLCYFCFISLSYATEIKQVDRFDYGLKPQLIAPNTYVLIGLTEDFSLQNGGNIVNTAFIVTEAGVIVIDTGPSLRYGTQLRAAIAKITDKPIHKVFNTHHHPDHCFGNQAFQDVPIAALAGTVQGIKTEGNGFSDNLYRMSGDWMRGTEPFVPTETVEAGELTIGNHQLHLLALQGHTAADLVIVDKTTGVIFVGDLIFYNRTSTTPHANLTHWLAALDTLEKIPFKKMVQGHGEILDDLKGLHQTRDYLTWLQTTLEEAASKGMDMAEVIQQPIPEPFASLALARHEFSRSVVHLYPALEAKYLTPAR